MGLIPGQRTKIEHVIWCGQIKKKKKGEKVVSGAMSSTVDVSIWALKNIWLVRAQWFDSNSDQESGLENICNFAETPVHMSLFYVQEITFNNKKRITVQSKGQKF